MTKAKVWTDPITGMMYGELTDSVLNLARFTNGEVFIFRNEPGQTFHRVTNPDYDYAETPKDFRDLVRRFDTFSAERN